MVEMPVKDVRMPDLHLPDAVTNFEWPKIELPSVDVGKAIDDVGKAIDDAAVAAHIRRRSRPRLPFAIVGLLVAGAAGWMVLTNTALRARVASGSRALRAQISALRTTSFRARTDDGDAVAFPAAETAPMESSPLNDDTPGDAAGYPTGLGSKNGKKSAKGPRAFEGTTSPA